MRGTFVRFHYVALEIIMKIFHETEYNPADALHAHTQSTKYTPRVEAVNNEIYARRANN